MLPAGNQGQTCSLGQLLKGHLVYSEIVGDDEDWFEDCLHKCQSKRTRNMDDATCFVVRDVVTPGTRVTWVSLFRPASLLLQLFFLVYFKSYCQK